MSFSPMFLHDDGAASDSSLSTNATAANLPGPGRTLGLAYDFAGAILERLLKPKRESPDFIAEPFDAPGISSESIDTNATAPNLPGPGRTLGLAYEFTGQMLESRLNALAARFGYGPEEAASRAREKRENAMLAQMKSMDLGEYKEQKLEAASNYFKKKRDQPLAMVHTPSNASYFSYGQVKLSPTKAKRLRKDCLRLLKYAKSDVASTQLQALDHLIDLLVFDPSMRELLGALGAESILRTVQLQAMIWTDKNGDLILNRSRKALISLSEVKVSTVCNYLGQAVSAPAGKTDSVLFNQQFSQLFGFLRSNSFSDPEVSFIAVRQLMRLSEDVYPWFLRHDGILAKLAELVTTCPDLVEWEVFENFMLVFYETGINQDTAFDLSDKYNVQRFGDTRHWAVLLEFFTRNAERFPRVISLIDRSMAVLDTIDESDLRRFPIFVWRALEAIVDFHQLDQVRLNLDNVREWYPSPRLSRTWRTLIFLPNLLMRQILLERLFDDLVPSDIDKVANSKRLKALCDQMVVLLLSEDGLTKERTLKFVRSIGGLDRYCRDAVLCALSDAHKDYRDTRFVDAIEELRQIPSITRVGPAENIWIFRHRVPAEVGGVHIRFHEPFLPCRHLYCESCSHRAATESDPDLSAAAGQYELPQCDNEYIKLTTADVLWLEISPDAPFDPALHRPVIAGIKASRTKEVIALVKHTNYPGCEGQSPYSEYFCTVEEGARHAAYLDGAGVVRTSERFSVLVSRFDLESLTEGELDTGESGAVSYDLSLQGLDPTGPLVWRRAEERQSVCSRCKFGI